MLLLSTRPVKYCELVAYRPTAVCSVPHMYHIVEVFELPVTFGM